MSLKELGKILGGNLAETQMMQSSLVKPGSAKTKFVFNTYRIKPTSIEFEIQKRDAGDSFILGGSGHGILGTNKLGTVNAGTWSVIYSSTDVQSITNDGKNIVRDYIYNGTTNPDYFAIGTGTNTYSSNDSSLGSQTEMLGNSLFSSDVSTDFECKMIYGSYPGQITTGTITECGWLSSSSGGRLFSRRMFGSISIDDGYWYKFTETIKFIDNSSGYSLITSEGLNLFRDWLGGVTSDTITYSGFGVGTGTLASDRTKALVSEQYRTTFSHKEKSDKVVKMITLMSSSNPVDSLGTNIVVKLHQTGLMNGSIGSLPTVLDNCDDTSGWGSTTYSEPIVLPNDDTLKECIVLN
jgi:hypothetical protein